VGGHRYRTKSVGAVLAEAAMAKELFPQMKELFFDDDTFTDDRRRAEEIAVGLGQLGLTWSCNAKANVPRETLQIMRDNGLRLLLVGYESGDQQILINIKKGLRVERAKQFAKDCRDLGITIHGTFILGLPGETKETIQETIKFAREVNPHTIQVSVAAPYPGTELYRQAKENGWLPPDDEGATLVSASGTQLAAVLLPRTEDRRDVRRDAPPPVHGRAAPARGHRVHPVPRPPRPHGLAAVRYTRKAARASRSGHVLAGR
jgi:radical SAM superfamily enzyme YgiQ (UPF0313 family)